MKICARCDMPIRGTDYAKYDIAAPTGGGATIYLHVELCKKVPTQTTQVSLRH